MTRSHVRFGLVLSGSCAMAARALGCSGPGAARAIQRAEELGWGLWFACFLGAVCVSLFPRRRATGWRRWVLGLLLVVHPGLWLSARSGDCGTTRVAGSVLVTVVFVIVAAVLYFTEPRRAR